MTFSIIKDALEYYDTNNEKYNDIKNKIKYIKQVPKKEGDLDIKRLDFFDENKKLLFTSRIEFISTYYNDINIWIWAWSHPFMNKSICTTIKKVLLYGIDMYTDNLQNRYFKSKLTTSRFYINSQIELDILSSISSYLSKNPFIIDILNFPIAKTIDFVDITLNKKADTDITYYLYILDYPEI
jgi:hypothetical protein